MDDREQLKKRIKELEMELDETLSLSRARQKLFESNIEELEELYRVLKQKLQELVRKDSRIKEFEIRLAEANKLATIGELAGSIAHEIKNPLISIQGFAERIEKTKDEGKAERYARLIGHEAQRLSQVLARLLDFARMNEPKKELVSMNEVVDDTVLFMEHHLTRFKHIQLEVEKEENLPLVELDRIQVQQTIVNIIMNAAQAMPGGGTVKVATAKQNGFVVLLISDTGTGISEEAMKRIFEPFFTTKDRGEGTGLGLSLCKKFVEANGGTIEVETEMNKGTTFRILFPFPGNH